MATTTRQTAREWFAENMTHWYYCPEVETVEQGRARCALALAVAEQWARANGGDVVWDHDPDADVTDTDQPAWVCVIRVGDDVAVSGGHQMVTPGDGPAMRVVEAELAAELLARVCARS
jgi:hypothetical protein